MLTFPRTNLCYRIHPTRPLPSYRTEIVMSMSASFYAVLESLSRAASDIYLSEVVSRNFGGVDMRSWIIDPRVNLPRPLYVKISTFGDVIGAPSVNQAFATHFQQASPNFVSIGKTSLCQTRRIFYQFARALNECLPRTLRKRGIVKLCATNAWSGKREKYDQR